MATEVERSEVERKLKERGWNLTPEGMEMCVQKLGKQKCSMESISSIAADYDLKDIGASILNEDIKRGRASLIEGPIVLQVQKVRNISAPKANEDSSFAPRLLKIQLTDGHTTCLALENSPVQQLSLVTPPGSKICLKGTIPICAGFLLLNANNIVKHGGKVEKILAKWETNRNINEQRSKAMLGDEGPPLFIPFDVKASSARNTVDTMTQKVKQISLTQNNNPNKRSFDQEKLSGAQANVNDGADKNNRRNQNNRNIEHYNDQNRSSKKNVQNKEKGSHGNRQENRVSKKSSTDHRQHERKNGPNSDRKDVKYDDDDYHGQRSTKGTLWDFVESTLPIDAKKTKSDDAVKKTDLPSKLPENNKKEIVTKNTYKTRNTDEQSGQSRRFNNGFYENDNRRSRDDKARVTEFSKSKNNGGCSNENERREPRQQRRDLPSNKQSQNNSNTTTRNTRAQSGGPKFKETTKQEQNKNHETRSDPNSLKTKTKAVRQEDIRKQEYRGELSERVQGPSSTKQSVTAPLSTNRNLQPTRLCSNHGGNTAQHWWRKGEHCLAFCSADGQDNCVASVLDVKPHTRSCLVHFEHSQTTESIQWSRLFPLDNASKDNFNRSTIPDATNPVRYQQIPEQQYGAGPIMTGGWMNQQQNPYQYHNPYDPHLVNMGNQVNPALLPNMARPTQQFYRPPSRY